MTIEQKKNEAEVRIKHLRSMAFVDERTNDVAAHNTLLATLEWLWGCHQQEMNQTGIAASANFEYEAQISAIHEGVCGG